MENWVAIVAIVGGVLAIAGSAGAIAVWFRASYNRARTEALQKDVEIYMQREVRYEKQNLELQGKVETLEQQVASLERQRDDAREMATQRAAVDALATTIRSLIESLSTHHSVLKTHHIESTEAWDRIEELLKVLVRKLELLEENLNA